MAKISIFAQALKKHKNASRNRRKTIISLSKAIPKITNAKSAENNSVSVVIKDGNAYSVTWAEGKRGIRYGIEPVYVCSLDPPALATMIQKVLKSNIKLVSKSEEDELQVRVKKRTSAILQATHSNSWRQLKTTGQSYYLFRDVELNCLVLSLHNENEKVKLHTDTSMIKIASLILKDSQKTNLLL